MYTLYKYKYDITTVSSDHTIISIIFILYPNILLLYRVCDIFIVFFTNTILQRAYYR